MKSQGISRFLVVARGRENRSQTKMLAGFGEELGVSIRYSPVRFDALNTGSADATLRDLDYWDVDEPVLVFPTDSLYEFSLPRMLEVHENHGSTMTVAAMARTPAEMAGKYGAMRTDPDGLVRAFVEKPPLAKLLHPAFGLIHQTALGRQTAWASGGMYLLDAARIRKYAQDPELVAAREVRLDFGKDLFPWLIRNDGCVYAYPASATGDLGTAVDYLASMVTMLRGGFPSLAPLLGRPLDAERRVWIPPETLQLPDRASGMTLEEKLEKGLVVIEGNVRLGRYVEVGVGVYLTDSNIDDGVEIGDQASIRGSAVRDGTRIGPAAALHTAYVGTMCDLDSTSIRRTVVSGGVALGDEVVVEAGTNLEGPLVVQPRTTMRAGVRSVR